jgi:potassium-transporting ATPase KdpC subunit
MKNNKRDYCTARELFTTVRIVIFTMIVCSGFYTLFVYAIGRGLMPYTAEGSLVTDARGRIVGSELLAQRFSRPEYIWPRPSAVDYDASAAGGSNLSPANPKLRERAINIIRAMGTNVDNPIPADLVTASGSGLDPDITLDAANYQADRVAKARGISKGAVVHIIKRHAKRTGGAFVPEPLVNVLEINVDLDKTVE